MHISSTGHWEVSSTRFSLDWQVTATLLLSDLASEFEYNSTLGTPVPTPSGAALPAFFTQPEPEPNAEEAISFPE